jgi:hypothetical protein
MCIVYMYIHVHASWKSSSYLYIQNSLLFRYIATYLRIPASIGPLLRISMCIYIYIYIYKCMSISMYVYHIHTHTACFRIEWNPSAFVLYDSSVTVTRSRRKKNYDISSARSQKTWWHLSRGDEILTRLRRKRNTADLNSRIGRCARIQHYNSIPSNK